MDLKFKKLAFQQNKFQLIWTSFAHPNHPFNLNYPNCPVEPECTQCCVLNYLGLLKV